MKVIHQIVLGLNGMVSLYFLYMTAMHTYVYFANKSLGHDESFSVAARYIGIAAVFLIITLLGWFLMKQANTTKIGIMILYLPLFIAVLYGLFAILLIISSGGKWN